MDRVEQLPRGGVLPGYDLVEPLDLHEPERRGELAHAEVQAGDVVVGLAVVAVGAREGQQVVVAGDQDAALAGGDRLRGVQRVDAGVAEGSRAPAVPRRAVGMRAVFEQEHVMGGAQRRDPLALEPDVAADVHQYARARTVALDLRLEIGERQAEVVALAVYEHWSSTGGEDRQRRGHERVRG